MLFLVFILIILTCYVANSSIKEESKVPYYIFVTILCVFVIVSSILLKS